MASAFVPFHGFRVPLIGMPDDESLQECEDCHDEFDMMQVRISQDGHFRCDLCSQSDSKFFPKP